MLGECSLHVVERDAWEAHHALVGRVEQRQGETADVVSEGGALNAHEGIAVSVGESEGARLHGISQRRRISSRASAALALW